jgi:predicted nucleic acid-binding protein
MRTAIDTNILSALLSNEPTAAAIAQQLSVARGDGALLLSPAVYSELLAYPNLTEPFVNHFLEDTGVAVEFLLSEAVWLEAGRRFARYAERRRRSSHGQPKRLLADFVIGAHALLQADRLMTLDPARYKQDFPELKLMAS